MFQPTGRVKFHSGRSFGIDELYEWIAKERDPHIVAGYVSGIYNFDMPWTYHLERILKISKPPFQNQAHMKVVVDWYIGVINKAEEMVYNETNVSIDLCYHTNGSHRALASLERS